MEIQHTENTALPSTGRHTLAEVNTGPTWRETRRGMGGVGGASREEGKDPKLEEDNELFIQWAPGLRGWVLPPG